MTFDLLKPSIFAPLSSIDAGFTVANRTSVNRTGTIPGLNLGDNTKAPHSEISDNFSTLFPDRPFLALAEQVHDSNVALVDTPGIVMGTDGLVTDCTALSIGIKVADCAALLLADPVHRVIGALHAGWRGAAAGIIMHGVNAMKQCGACPETMYVYISPCISEKNFEVGEEVAAQFPEAFVLRTNPKPHVDLKKFLTNELLTCGIPLKQVECDPGCTMDSDRFYSYRREGDNAGRMLAYITMKK